MSQKKLKKLRKLETVKTIKETVLEPFFGFCQILKENWKFLLILCLGVFVLYFNGLHGDFVSDDYATITQNPDVKNFSVMLKMKSLPSISNSIIAIFFDTTSSFPYHLYNLILYLSILVVAFVFVFLITKSKKTSMLTLILYAVLPVHVENISWISGKPYLFVAFFLLLSLDLLILYLNKKEKKYLWLLLPSLFFLFFSDPVRGSAIIFVGLLYFLTFRKSFNSNLKISQIFIGLSIVTFILAIYFWPMIQTRIAAVNGGYNGSGDSLFYNPFFQYPLSVAKYLQLMLFPADLTLYHTMYIIPSWLNWMIILTFLTVVGYFFFKDKKMFFALAFIFLATAPSMAPVKVSWLVAERYVLLGSLGLCLFLVLFFQRFGKKWELPFFILFIAVTSLYSVRVYLRNDDWQTNHKLWVRTVQVSPNSHNAWNNIGDDYDKLAQLENTDNGKMKQYENAVKGFTQSTVVKQNYADAYHNRANIFYKMGRLDMARDSYETALSYSNNNLFQSLISLIQIDLNEKRMDLALDHVQKLQKAKPNDLQVYYITAVVYANAGMRDEAKKVLIQILQVYPQFKEAKDLLDQLNKP